MSLTYSSTNGVDFFVRAFNITDNVQTGYKIGRTAAGAGNYVNVVLPLYAEVNDNTLLRLEIQNISNSDNVVIRSGAFELHYVHD